jgi:hypothetical protein
MNNRSAAGCAFRALAAGQRRCLMKQTRPISRHGVSTVLKMNAIARFLFTITAVSVLGSSAFARQHKEKTPGTPVAWKDLPAAVQATIQSNAGAGKVAEVNKTNVKGRLVYLAEVKGTDRNWTKVYVTATGTLMKVEPDHARNKRKHRPLFGSKSLLDPANPV